MKIAILGAGAMGCLFGAHLAETGNEVTLIDVNEETIDRLTAGGVTVEERSGETRQVRLGATREPGSIGQVDLVLLFVKCHHTEPAARAAAPLLAPHTAVLTLQNGWGNAARLQGVLGNQRVLAGVTYHSATVLEPGHILHGGKGMTFLGELTGQDSPRMQRIAITLQKAKLDATPTHTVRLEIWKKLALNVATLATSASIRVTADRLMATEAMQGLMRGLLEETVAVAQAQKIPLDLEERWGAITGLLGKLAPGTRGSMLQDVENQRPTEIDVINGAIVAAGKEHGVPTPRNEAMVALIRALEATFG